LQKRSDVNTEKHLDEAVRKLHAASEDLRNDRTGSGRTLKMMSGVLNDLVRAAEVEGKIGTLRNSEALANSAKQLHDSIRSLHRGGESEEKQRAELAGILDGLTRTLTGAKNMSTNTVPFLEQTLAELTEAKKYLEFLSRNPDAAERLETERETAFLLQKLAGALNGIGRGGSSVTGNMSAEKLIRSVDEALKHPGSEEALSPVIDQLDKFVAVMKISVRSHVFQPDEIPEKYREEARRYFERLSRQEEGKK